MNFKIRDLDDAIENVLGKDVVDAMKSGSVVRPTIHMSACLRCFEKGLANEDSRIIREAWIALSKTGFYPKEMWEND
jgi:hypothetical protein